MRLFEGVTRVSLNGFRRDRSSIRRDFLSRDEKINFGLSQIKNLELFGEIILFFYNCVKITRFYFFTLTKVAYSTSTRILVALDCIIFGFDGEALKLLLIKRNFEPQSGKWSLMGGFLEEDEDLSDAAARILYNLTGLRNNYLEQLQTFGTVNRDRRADDFGGLLFAG